MQEKREDGKGGAQAGTSGKGRCSVVYREDTQRNTGDALRIHGGQSTEVYTRRQGAERKGVACTEDIQRREERGRCRTEDRGRQTATDSGADARDTAAAVEMKEEKK